jgi:hypothetical protein
MEAPATRATIANTWEGGEAVRVMINNVTPTLPFTVATDGKLSTVTPLYWNNYPSGFSAQAWYPGGYTYQTILQRSRQRYLSLASAEPNRYTTETQHQVTFLPFSFYEYLQARKIDTVNKYLNYEMLFFDYVNETSMPKGVELRDGGFDFDWQRKNDRQRAYFGKRCLFGIASARL